MSSSCTPAADADTPAPGAPRGDAGTDRADRAAARRAWRTYFEATQRLTEALERRLKEQTGLTLADYNTLLLLWEAPEGALRMGELASRMVFSPSRVTYEVKCLMGRGLVERRPAACDGRGYEAVLTDAGRTAFRRAAAVHARHIDELFLDGLEPGEAAALDRVFARLSTRLQSAR